MLSLMEPIFTRPLRLVRLAARMKEVNVTVGHMHSASGQSLTKPSPVKRFVIFPQNYGRGHLLARGWHLKKESHLKLLQSFDQSL